MKRRGKAMQWLAAYLALLIVLIALESCRTPAGRITGEAVDAATVAPVRAELFDENILRGFAISVDSFDGWRDWSAGSGP